MYMKKKGEESAGSDVYFGIQVKLFLRAPHGNHESKT